MLLQNILKIAAKKKSLANKLRPSPLQGVSKQLLNLQAHFFSPVPPEFDILKKFWKNILTKTSTTGAAKSRKTVGNWYLRLCILIGLTLALHRQLWPKSNKLRIIFLKIFKFWSNLVVKFEYLSQLFEFSHKENRRFRNLFQKMFILCAT